MNVSRAIDLPILPHPVKRPGFYRDTQMEHRVVVLGESLTVLGTWECPSNPDDQFTSPLINFNNMHHMGGYTWRPNHPRGPRVPLVEQNLLLDRVLDGVKPAASTGYMCEAWNSSDEANLRTATTFRQRVIVSGLGATRLYKSGNWPRYGFGFAREGTLHDNYDLTAWRAAWVAYGLDAVIVDDMVARYGGCTLLDLVNVFEQDEYELPPHIRGLVLGYPLCTTIQYMRGRLWV